MEVLTGHLSYLDIIPWSAIDERLAHQLQSVSVVEVLVATPLGVNYLLDNVSQEVEKRLPLAARRGVLRCSAVGEHPYGSNWWVFLRFFVPADVSQSLQPFVAGKFQCVRSQQGTSDCNIVGRDSVREM